MLVSKDKKAVAVFFICIELICQLLGVHGKSCTTKVAFPTLHYIFFPKIKKKIPYMLYVGVNLNFYFPPPDYKAK